ncbi:hypothetical protein ES708_00260 [subsurface metagenome]
MDIEREVEKILEVKGVAPPGMTHEQFIEKLGNRLIEAIPLVMGKTVSGIANEIMIEELERLGRREPCRFWRARECRKFGKQPDCPECTHYKPRSRWSNWVRLPEFWEPVLIGLAVTSFVAAIFVEEIRVFTLCFWLGTVVVSRLQIWWMCRKLRKGKVT